MNKTWPWRSSVSDSGEITVRSEAFVSLFFFYANASLRSTPAHPAESRGSGAARRIQTEVCYTLDTHSAPPATSPHTSCERHVGMATLPAHLSP